MDAHFSYADAWAGDSELLFGLGPVGGDPQGYWFVPGSSVGWMSGPAQVIGVEAVEPSRRRSERAGRREGGWRGIVTSWRTPATRSLALGVC
jgi:hypothetical protein